MNFALSMMFSWAEGWRETDYIKLWKSGAEGGWRLNSYQDKKMSDPVQFRISPPETSFRTGLPTVGEASLVVEGAQLSLLTGCREWARAA
jgi:hypothetical protein